MANTDVPDTPMRRIMVVGCPGAGKSTFARRLAGVLALPVIHLDFHHWRSGWELPDLQDWRDRCTALAATPAWVMPNFNTVEDKIV